MTTKPRSKFGVDWAHHHRCRCGVRWRCERTGCPLPGVMTHEFHEKEIERKAARGTPFDEVAPEASE